MLIKSYETTFKSLGEGAPLSEGELARINRYALEPLTAEQIYVRRMRLCNDQVDRSFERFPVSYLERFAETLPGKALLVNHATGSRSPVPPALGRFFQAELEQEAGVTYLVPSFYLLRTAGNAEARQQIDGGVWSHVSIGARVDTLFCDLCGRDYWTYGWDEHGNFIGCRHVLGHRYDGVVCTGTYGGELARVEAVEGSIVWLGCQYGAEMSKAAGGWGPRRDKEALLMETERGSERARERESEVAVLEAELAEARAAGAVEGQRAEGLRERLAMLERRQAEDAPYVTDGRRYREDLRGEMKRLAGLVGAEKECEAILAAGVEIFDAARLKELVAEYGARFEKAFPPTGAGAPSPARPNAATDLRTPRVHCVI